ncbi:(-)-isopiperitenol/(-)-carveol dehydrogenase [Salix suchowensis]|nr:(-)-isopiperitenol/(-)-carveol dehydrogenase [Salix suchowensis]
MIPLTRQDIFATVSFILSTMANAKPCKNKVQDKVAIVTGGAGGIGEVTVLAFVENGARGVVIADIQDEKGQKLAESIGANRSTYIHCDVTDENQVKSLVESTVQLYGQLDVIFCNAGVMSFGKQTVLDFDLDYHDKLFAINVRGVAACLKHAARAMVEGGVKGSIICTASTIASVVRDMHTDYIMSKCGVIALMKCASYQLSGHGIRVNCVSPGPVATPLACKTIGMGVEAAEEAFEPHYCLEGVLKAKHVADAVVFLASADSEFVTGHNLVVDGGYHFQGSLKYDHAE